MIKSNDTVWTIKEQDDLMLSEQAFEEVTK